MLIDLSKCQLIYQNANWSIDQNVCLIPWQFFVKKVNYTSETVPWYSCCSSRSWYWRWWTVLLAEDCAHWWWTRLAAGHGSDTSTCFSPCLSATSMEIINIMSGCWKHHPDYKCSYTFSCPLRILIVWVNDRSFIEFLFLCSRDYKSVHFLIHILKYIRPKL